MLVPAAVTSVTRNTPISSALAVVAVRCGLRAVLSTASRPSSPNRDITGRASREPPMARNGPATITPTNSSSAPKPIAAHEPPASSPAGPEQAEAAGEELAPARERGRVDRGDAQRLDRLGPCGATRGDHRRDERDHRADEDALDHRAEPDLDALPGSSTPTALSTRISTHVSRNPATTPSVAPIRPWIRRPSISPWAYWPSVSLC